MTISAEYYDGIRSNAQAVSLRFEEGRLVVHSPILNRDDKIDLRDVAKVESLNGKFHIELKSPSPAEPAHLYVFEDRDFYDAVLKAWARNGNLFQTLIREIPMLSLGRRIAVLLIGTFLAIFGFYFTVINLHHVVPLSYDTYLGNKVESQFLDIFEPYENDTALTQFLTETKDILKDSSDIFDISVQVVNSSIVNAVALPGGKVVLFSGLIAQSNSPEEIAGILAHEIAHAQKRHNIQQLIRSVGFTFLSSMIVGVVLEGVEVFEAAEVVTEISSTLLLLKYSRGFEKDADLEAIKRLHENQISVEGLYSFFDRMTIESKKKRDTSSDSLNVEDTTDSKSNMFTILSTHPGNEERMVYLKDAMSREQFVNSPQLMSDSLWEVSVQRCKELKSSSKFETLFKKKKKEQK